jgi:hypothetical protein
MVFLDLLPLTDFQETLFSTELVEHRSKESDLTFCALLADFCFSHFLKSAEYLGLKKLSPSPYSTGNQKLHHFTSFQAGQTQRM